MKIVGIVVEYNPIHNGHIYHFNKVNEAFPDAIKIAVMSGDFVQRGEPALINKKIRSKLCLDMGIDIVIELPSYYSTQSAELFARGSIGILESMDCEYVVFGSEKNDIESLNKIIDIENSNLFKKKLKENLKEGLSFPNAYSNSINNISNEKINLESNDILGLEYIKAINFWNSKIIPISIERKGTTYYNENKDLGISSATQIRNMIKSGRYEDLGIYIPQSILNFIKEEKFTFLEQFYPLIRYEIINNYKVLKDIQGMEIGLDIRINKFAKQHKEFEEFFASVLTKRLTITRLQRILIHILIGLTKDITDIAREKIPYVRILGFNNRGKNYLNILKMSKGEDFRNVLTSYKNINKLLKSEEKILLEFNEKASLIYRMINDYKDNDYPIIKEEKE